MNTKTKIWSNLLDGPETLIRMVSALILAASLLSAQSQPSAPTPRVAGKTEQQKKTDKNAVPKTSEKPAALRAQPVPPPATEDTRNESAKSAPSPVVVVNVNTPKSELNDWLLTVFTAGLVGIGILQWRTLQAHHEVMKTSAEAAKSSAETLALQRGVMDTQAGYIGSMLTEINKSAEAAQSSAEISKRALYISQRPLITVDVTMASGIHGQAYGTSDMDKLSNSLVRIEFRNLGNTAAKDFYFSMWVTGNHGRHLIAVSHKTPLAPGRVIEETSETLSAFMAPIEIAGLIDKTTKVCGFVRYKTLFDELPGIYIEFHALWDNSIRQFRITPDEREDGGYPEPS